MKNKPYLKLILLILGLMITFAWLARAEEVTYIDDGTITIVSNKANDDDYFRRISEGYNRFVAPEIERRQELKVEKVRMDAMVELAEIMNRRDDGTFYIDSVGGDFFGLRSQPFSSSFNQNTSLVATTASTATANPSVSSTVSSVVKT